MLSREWILLLGLVMVWCVVIAKPLLDARREARDVARVDAANAAAASTSTARDVHALLTREVMLQACLDQDPEWLTYCERRFLFESVRVIQDVCTWKRYFYDKTESWRKAKALGIYKSYVSEHALLECNVDAGVRDAVERRIRALQSGGAPRPSTCSTCS